MAARIKLPNDCTCSKLTVFPSNWKTKKASVRFDWYISYRFYDPAFPKPKQRVIKGMNEFKVMKERQMATHSVLKDEMNLLLSGYNPHTGIVKSPARKEYNDSEISPQTPLIKALEIAAAELKCNSKLDLRSVLKYFSQAAALLQKDKIPIGEIKRRDLRLILNACQKVKEKNGMVWNANQFNYYRSHVSMLFAFLEADEIIEYNPVAKIKKADHAVAIRTVLTNDQRKTINDHLLQKVPEFHRYVHIFFHSGARRAELMRVQGKHIDLPNQRFQLLVKKRKKMAWEWKTIKDIALPFWQEAMKGCKAEDFVFSAGLMPGKVQIQPKQITLRWKRHVKDELKIDVDFYSIKHLHTTEVIDLLENDPQAEQAIADHNSHTSTAMVVNIYDVNHQNRKHKKIKSLKNAFA